VVNVLGAISGPDQQSAQCRLAGARINFVLVFSPNAFKGAPHSMSHLVETYPDPAGDARIIKQVADAFPMVTSVRVREALETVGKSSPTSCAIAAPAR